MTQITLLEAKKRLGLDVFSVKDETMSELPHREKQQLLYNLFGDEVIYNIKHRVNELPKFSYYKAPIKQVIPYRDIALPNIYEAIKNPKYYGQRTKEFRQIKSKELQREYKSKYFDYVTFSGTFERRHSSALTKHSNYICFDIDNCNPAKTIKIIHKVRDVQTQLIYTSPSGNGVKWVIDIDNGRTHEQMFLIVQNYMKKAHGIDIDKSGKDISRASFVCHDPECYINPKLI